MKGSSKGVLASCGICAERWLDATESAGGTGDCGGGSGSIIGAAERDGSIINLRVT